MPSQMVHDLENENKQLKEQLGKLSDLYPVVDQLGSMMEEKIAEKKELLKQMDSKDRLIDSLKNENNDLNMRIELLETRHKIREAELKVTLDPTQLGANLPDPVPSLLVLALTWFPLGFNPTSTGLLTSWGTPLGFEISIE
ncbi:unnamed protein product [Timema podura]|uniref:Uncharacterized protein n=1 Tax=Timema podura TaxID=61482 RepID=A0ABN7PGL1_TIMPD|nr:unnamed protein product [Timema podura]